MERFNFQLSVTARFDEGDPTYEWIVLFLTEENVWRRSRDFTVNAKNSKRKWAVNEPELEGSADYVPTYELPQLFRWRGYWVEVRRSGSGGRSAMAAQTGQAGGGVIFISIYTLKMKALSELVEEARERYKVTSRPNVTVHMADSPTYGPTFVWSNVKQKARRPLSSIILPDGVVASLIKDAQEFIDTEAWYVEAGIPHRRGYLLYGPPGTGKTSTIYALAGELGLEIYSLSLSAGFIDDTFLQKAASSIPKNSILLIEDIDCAFPSRDDEDDEEPNPMNQFAGLGGVGGMKRAKSAVTLSGLLNVLDGVGSEEGKLFFATTNYVDRLDPALLRPGRIDKKVEYHASTKEQASALFMRFFCRPGSGVSESMKEKENMSPAQLSELADQFSGNIPHQAFTTAELQGFLLLCKKQPELAVNTISEWVAGELAERKAKEEREAERRRKTKEKREQLGGDPMSAMAAQYGGLAAMYGGLGGFSGAAGLIGGANTTTSSPKTPMTPTPPYAENQKQGEVADEGAEGSSESSSVVVVVSEEAAVAA